MFYFFEGELLLPDASYEQKVHIFLLIQAAPSGRIIPMQRFLPGWDEEKGCESSMPVKPALFLTSVL